MTKSVHIVLETELETEPDEYDTVASQHGTRLLETESGRWWFYPDKQHWGWAMEFQKEKDARLMYGLWLRTGGFSTAQTPSQYIPIEVVREGKDAVAAYLLVATGVSNSRLFVAQKLDVSKQTVSNYANRVRYNE